MQPSRFGSQRRLVSVEKYLRVSWWLRPEKNLAAMRETWVPSPDWEDPRKEDMVTYVLFWRIPMDRIMTG